ncbi:MAG TPA: ABC transporter ATP-binding protein [Negativicutes bacterium]|nr:ABC transporter ATP-binding protein [Negativicutes bacterium]
MIKTAGLMKHYGGRVVLDDLNLHIRPGEIFGLLGPNGAGKTTLIRILTLLTQPSAGKIVINGWPAAEQALRIKTAIGLVPQHFNLDNELTVRENLELHGRLHHLAAAERRKRVGKLLDYVELAPRADDLPSTFSGGMKRRLMIARALLHKPSILFLDEPTVGLDPQVRRRLWTLIKSLNNDGLTVLLTTHYIEEAESLCGRVAIMDKGRLIAQDSPAALCRRCGELVVEWQEGEAVRTRFFADRHEAAQFAGTVPGNALLRRTNLEDVFVELTGRKVAE